MIKNIHEVYEKFYDEFLKFDRIENPVCKRPDICAFLLLDKIVPNDSDIVSFATYDEIYLDVDPEEFAKKATEEDLLFLVRCGVRIFEDSFWMYV